MYIAVYRLFPQDTEVAGRCTGDGDSSSGRNGSGWNSQDIGYHPIATCQASRALLTGSLAMVKVKPELNSTMFRPRTSLNQQLIGRTDIIHSLHQRHLEHDAYKESPRISVITGPEGSGSSQIALRLALDYETR